ncbi:MAG: hypothetical protein V4710_07720, partial [Verrucomicrobiota bacterium]
MRDFLSGKISGSPIKRANPESAGRIFTEGRDIPSGQSLGGTKVLDLSASDPKKTAPPGPDPEGIVIGRGERRDDFVLEHIAWGVRLETSR